MTLLNILTIYSIKILFMPWNQDQKPGGPLSEWFCFIGLSGMSGILCHQFP